MLNYSMSLDRVFHGLADPTRRLIVEQLSAGPASVKTLAAPFDMSLPAVMLHLQVLDSAGMITTRKEGRVRICELQKASLMSAEDWMSHRRSEWDRVLHRLEEFLDGDEKV